MHFPDQAKEALHQDLYLTRGLSQWRIGPNPERSIPPKEVFRTLEGVRRFCSERQLTLSEEQLSTLQEGGSISLSGFYREYLHHSYDVFFKEVSLHSSQTTVVLDGGEFTTAFIVHPNPQDIAEGREGVQVHFLHKSMAHRPSFDYEDTARKYL